MGADEELRELERRVAAGDESAVHELAELREARGFDPVPEVRRILQATLVKRRRDSYGMVPGGAGWRHVQEVIAASLGDPAPVGWQMADPDVWSSKATVLFVVKDVGYLALGAGVARVSESRSAHYGTERKVTPGGAWPDELHPWSRLRYMPSDVLPCSEDPGSLTAWARRPSPDRVAMTPATARRLLDRFPVSGADLDLVRDLSGGEGRSLVGLKPGDLADMVVRFAAPAIAKYLEFPGGWRETFSWERPDIWRDEFGAPVFTERQRRRGYVPEQVARVATRLGREALRLAVERLFGRVPAGF